MPDGQEAAASRLLQRGEQRPHALHEVLGNAVCGRRPAQTNVGAGDLGARRWNDPGFMDTFKLFYERRRKPINRQRYTTGIQA